MVAQAFGSRVQKIKVKPGHKGRCPLPRISMEFTPSSLSLLLAGKKGHPREAKIMSIHEDILDKQVGAATVL